MSDTNWSLKERCTTDDMCTRSFREFERKSCSSKTFGFLSNKRSLELKISSCFSSLISSFWAHWNCSRHLQLIDTFVSVESNPLVWWRLIFKPTCSSTSRSSRSKLKRLSAFSYPWVVHLSTVTKTRCSTIYQSVHSSRHEARTSIKHHLLKKHLLKKRL